MQLKEDLYDNKYRKHQESYATLQRIILIYLTNIIDCPRMLSCIFEDGRI